MSRIAQLPAELSKEGAECKDPGGITVMKDGKSIAANGLYEILSADIEGAGK